MVGVVFFFSFKKLYTLGLSVDALENTEIMP